MLSQAIVSFAVIFVDITRYICHYSEIMSEVSIFLTNYGPKLNYTSGSITRFRRNSKTVSRNLRWPRLSSLKISHMDGNGEFACDAYCNSVLRSHFCRYHTLHTPLFRNSVRSISLFKSTRKQITSDQSSKLQRCLRTS